MGENLGKVTITPGVLTTIVRLTALEQRGVNRLASSPPNVRGLLAGGAADEGIFLMVGEEEGEPVVQLVELHVVAEADARMKDLGEALQGSVKRAVREMVGIEVKVVNVFIDDVALPPKQG